MDSTDNICHSGIIKTIDTQHIVVTILSEAACVSCHAKGACSVADIKEKEIEITKWSGNFKPGEQVEIISNASQGFRAVFLAYVLPLILMVTELFVVFNMTNNEMIAALGSLFLLASYYFILFIFRHKILNSLRFEIRKSAKLNQYE